MSHYEFMVQQAKEAGLTVIEVPQSIVAAAHREMSEDDRSDCYSSMRAVCRTIKNHIGLPDVVIDGDLPPYRGVAASLRKLVRASNSEGFTKAELETYNITKYPTSDEDGKYAFNAEGHLRYHGRTGNLSMRMSNEVYTKTSQPVITLSIPYGVVTVV